MGIDAMALLRVDPARAAGRTDVRLLEDAVIVFTGAPFGSEPEALAWVLRTAESGLLDQHVDGRGVLMIPDVAEVTARSYDAVVAEVGEGGTWVRPELADAVPAAYRAAPAGSFEALAGQMMGALGPDTLGQMMAAARSGDPAQLQALQAKMEAGLASLGGLEAVARKLQSALGAPPAGGPDALQQRLASLQSKLSSGQLSLDPGKLAELEKLAAEQLGRAAKGDTER